MSSAVLDMLDRFEAVHGAPRVDDPEQFAREFVRAVGGVAAGDLMRAADHLIAKSKWFPKPAEVLALCQRYADEREAEHRRAEPVPLRRVPPRDEHDRVSAGLRELSASLSREGAATVARVDAPAFEKMQAASANAVHAPQMPKSWRQKAASEGGNHEQH